jgi:tetratricopeptide (TPR) repeat protein
MKEALQICSTANLQGADKNVVALSKLRLGSAFVLLGETDKGEPLLRKAIVEYAAQSSEPRWEMGELVMMLGVAALNKDKPNEAQKYLANSERILRQTLGDKNIYLVTNLNYQATALAMQGDFKPAEEKARECLALAQVVSPQNKFQWAAPLRTLANILALAGQAKEGEDYYRQALGICERQATRNFSLIVPLKIQLCHLLLAQRRLTEAENLAFEAQTEAQRHFDERDPVRKAAANNLIQIYRTQGKDAVAQSVR